MCDDLKPKICRFCGRECKNDNSLRNHERLCKENPNRQILKSNFIEWNKRRRELGIKGENQFTKAKSEGREKPVVSEETKEKIRKKNTGRKFTDEERKKLSDAMKQVVERYPDKYNASRLHNRIKHFWYKDQWIDGKWELEFVQYLERNGIEWIKNKKWFEYEWNDSIHKYFPDFYLPKYDRYVEVKGYETDRDRAKYVCVSDLILVKEKEIKMIQDGSYNIFEILNA